MPQAFFLTGTDTEVGKTYTAAALLTHARRLGKLAVGVKPIASGTDAAGKNEDVEALRAASSAGFPEKITNTYLFSPPVAPHLAAAEAGVSIHFSPIREAVLAACQWVGETGVVVAEGVGGFCVPLGEEGDTADLAVFLGLPVILVVGMRLGCINHALLTAQAIARRDLILAGWIANTQTLPAMPRFAENLATLRTRLPAPLLGVVPAHPKGGIEEAARYLKLPEAG
ncbi:MAG: dethiobiotin synthase [Zoogloeaceae bacterium]|jgi:dethiobiotin synthetase|nr:dethiobiotin synthase [Zoogloeaceae bacterium]